MNRSSKNKTFLLLADISGYTHFMRETPVASSHARQIIIRLLKALINESAPPLTVAELEGDAVFFYATVPVDDLDRIASQIKVQMVRLFAGFQTERRKLSRMKACECDACSYAGDLKLKQILHVGEAAIERVNEFKKLFGVDVILVHKLLKNSVPSSEYILMTEQAHSVMRGFHGFVSQNLHEKVEEFGTLNVVVFYPVKFAHERARNNDTEPARTERLAWMLRLKWNTILDAVRFRLSSPSRPSRLSEGNTL